MKLVGEIPPSTFTVRLLSASLRANRALGYTDVVEDAFGFL